MNLATTPKEISYQQVFAFVEARRNDYEQLVKEVKHLLTTFSDSEEGRVGIYLVYSRGDRQPGNEELKNTWEVKEKLNRERHARYRLLVAEGRADEYTDLPLEGLHDIVGITVVCPHPLDEKAVQAHLEILQERGALAIHCREVLERGYRATHCAVELTAPPRLLGLLCEIQIKTILADAWTVWTHDLTYKPVAYLPPGLGLGRHMADAGAILNALDDQSDAFKWQVEQEWRFVRKTNEACRTLLLKSLVNRPSAKRDPEIYSELVSEINEQTAISDKHRLADRIREYAAGRWDHDSCRLITLLAVMGHDKELYYEARVCIDAWFGTADEPKERILAKGFLAFAAWCFNDMRTALRWAEDAVEAAVRLDDPDEVVRAKINLAHYLAEQGAAPGQTHGDRARRLIAETWPDSPRPLAPRELDSVGFVKIVFGEDAGEVEEGLRLCTEAYEAHSPEQEEAAALFFQQHKGLAERKLVHL